MEKLKEMIKMDINVQPMIVELSEAFDIKSGDVIYIFQHPNGADEASISSSQCKVAGECCACVSFYTYTYICVCVCICIDIIMYPLSPCDMNGKFHHLQIL